MSMSRGWMPLARHSLPFLCARSEACCNFSLSPPHLGSTCAATISPCWIATSSSFFHGCSDSNPKGDRVLISAMKRGFIAAIDNPHVRGSPGPYVRSIRRAAPCGLDGSEFSRNGSCHSQCRPNRERDNGHEEPSGKCVQPHIDGSRNQSQRWRR